MPRIRWITRILRPLVGSDYVVLPIKLDAKENEDAPRESVLIPSLASYNDDKAKEAVSLAIANGFIEWDTLRRYFMIEDRYSIDPIVNAVAVQYHEIIDSLDKLIATSRSAPDPEEQEK